MKSPKKKYVIKASKPTFIDILRRLKKDSQNGGKRTNTRSTNTRHKRPNRREK